MNKAFLSILSLLIFVSNLFAQEQLSTFYKNNRKVSFDQSSFAKTTALSLPFFEDFTNYETSPNPLKWKDALVYVN